MLSSGLSAQKPDSIKLLNEVFAITLAENPKKSVAVAENMLRLARQINDDDAAGEALFNLGQASYFQGQYEQAFAFYQKAEDALPPGNGKILGKVCNAIGNCYVEVEDYASALIYYTRALSLMNEPLEQVKIYNNIGSVNIYLARYDSAEFFFRKTMVLSDNDPKQRVVYLHNIAYIRYKTGKLTEAIDLYKQSIAHAEALHEDRYLPRFYKNLADCFLRYRLADSCRVYLEKSLSRSRESGRHAQEADALLSYSAYYDTLDQLEHAIQMAEEAQRAATRTSAYNHGKVFDQLSQLYSKAGNPVKALHFEKRHAQYLDSVRLVHQASAIAARSGNELDGESERTSNWLFLVIVFAAMLACLALLLAKRKTATNPPEVTPTEFLSDGKFIRGQHQGGETLLTLSDIIWFEKTDRLYYACTEKEKYRIKPTITELETVLPSHFVRINRAVIINLHFLLNYSSWENNKYVIRMKQPPGTEFISTRDRIKKIDALSEVKSR